MDMHDRVSSGLAGLDSAIDQLRLGDNVVWQVDSIDQYRRMVDPYVAQARLDGRKLIYVRFGSHAPLLEPAPDLRICEIEADRGFEHFATSVHQLVEQEGKRAFYLFDCLTELLACWHSDLMIGNFFRVACPYLYEFDTIAYFAIIRNVHTFATIAGIRETTQLLLDVYQVKDNVYIHPLKVQNRYSPTMFFPHLIRGQEAVCITASAEAAELFGAITRGEERRDYWDVLFAQAKEALNDPPEAQEVVMRRLMTMLIGKESRMFELCGRYFTLPDVLNIASREVGTGFIGGKSVGMLLARRIIEAEGGGRFAPYMEPHDSFYIGSDVFYTYIVQNGWWKLRMKQKSAEGYYEAAPELREKLLTGRFPAAIREKFMQLLEYYGQSPVIVRSSSLLEDNFGNAFAGKYESIFCVNQGTPEQRYEAFEQAVRNVYASTMNEDALAYRMNRGLSEHDEQMAILVQRVSGDYYQDHYFPHAAGVGNSSNLYVWDPSVEMEAGMLRLVLGLGTRAVDRTEGDYARIVALDNPTRRPLMDATDYKRFSQHRVDLLDLRDNSLTTQEADDVLAGDLRTPSSLFATADLQMAQRLKELGYNDCRMPHIVDFDGMLRETAFPGLMRDMLALLAKVYDYPVDIEFTVNFAPDGRFRVNLVQCRPLQTRGLGRPVKLPVLKDRQDCFFSSRGGFMGGNVRLSIDYVVYVRPESYLALSEQSKYAVARQIGRINAALKGKSALLAGPGRWGTSTPSLGVPVIFAELCHMAVICEVASKEAGFVPELSYGSHFFQDLVEAGIFYAALWDGDPDIVFNPERVLGCENVLTSLTEGAGGFTDVIHVARTDGMEIFADIVTQQLLCR